MKKSLPDPALEAHYMSSRRFIRWGVSASVLLIPSVGWSAATVNYQGNIYNTSDFYNPLGQAFVVAGTFAPGFDPYGYFEVYGDGFGNAVPGHYARAVADGAFRPIGSGMVTSLSFSGSGTTDAPAGTPIYLFGIGTPELPFQSLLAGVLATSTDPSFLVPPGMGTTTVDASLANVIVFGQRVGDGIGFAVLPFPEPTTHQLAAISSAMVFTIFTARSPRGRRV